MIWIIGEYAERIDNADELLESFLETFPDETSMVRETQTGLAVAAHYLCWYASEQFPPHFGFLSLDIASGARIDQILAAVLNLHLV